MIGSLAASKAQQRAYAKRLQSIYYFIYFIKSAPEHCIQLHFLGLHCCYCNCSMRPSICPEASSRSHISNRDRGAWLLSDLGFPSSASVVADCVPWNTISADELSDPLPLNLSNERSESSCSCGLRAILKVKFSCCSSATSVLVVVVLVLVLVVVAEAAFESAVGVIQLFRSFEMFSVLDA